MEKPACYETARKMETVWSHGT